MTFLQGQSSAEQPVMASEPGVKTGGFFSSFNRESR